MFLDNLDETRVIQFGVVCEVVYVCYEYSQILLKFFEALFEPGQVVAAAIVVWVIVTVVMTVVTVMGCCRRRPVRSR